MKVTNISKFLLIAGAVLLIGMLTITAASAGEIDFTTGQEYSEIQESELQTDLQNPITLNTPPSKKVLWDLTHGVFMPGWNYQPFGSNSSYGDLVDLLSSMGYAVDTTDVGVDNVSLAEYDVLVICLGSAWDSEYTPAEVAAIKNFVDNGGGLLIMGDTVETEVPPNANIAPIAQEFGTTVGISFISPPALTINDSNMADHPIFDGVSQISFKAVGEISGENPSSEVAWNDDGQAIVTVVNCPKVVITGDINFCDNVRLDDLDNSQFTENIFEWLAEPCQEPVPTDPMSYDANSNGAIEKAEVFDAINDYFADEITKDDVFSVIKAYFSS